MNDWLLRFVSELTAPDFAAAALQSFVTTVAAVVVTLLVLRRQLRHDQQLVSLQLEGARRLAAEQAADARRARMEERRINAATEFADALKYCYDLFEDLQASSSVDYARNVRELGRDGPPGNKRAVDVLWGHEHLFGSSWESYMEVLQHRTTLWSLVYARYRGFAAAKLLTTDRHDLGVYLKRAFEKAMHPSNEDISNYEIELRRWDGTGPAPTYELATEAVKTVANSTLGSPFENFVDECFADPTEQTAT